MMISGRRSKALIVVLLAAILWIVPSFGAFAQGPRSGRAAVIPNELLEFGLGLQPSQGDLPQLDRDELNAGLRVVLPPAVDLSENLPPVGSQGGLGSCVAWAVGYYGKTWQEQVERGWGTGVPEHVFSPSWIYNQRNTQGCNADEGMTLYNGLNIVKTKGAATLATFPYQLGDPCIQPPQAAIDEAWQYRIDSFANVFAGAGSADLNTLKALLANGRPILMAVPVYYPSFYAPTDDDPLVRRPAPDESLFGGHALLVVGYDDAIGGFQFVNSWGPGYGRDGFGYLAYNLVRYDVWEGWVMTDHIQEVPQQRQAQVSLLEGWNLVSLPLQPSNSQASAIFAPVAQQIDQVYVWDAENSRWQRYVPSAPTYANSLSSVSTLQGLWINARQDVVLTVVGDERPQTGVELKSGWNLVAFPGDTETPTTEALQSIADQVVLVHGYDTATASWITYHSSAPMSGDITTMVPGAAYWVQVSSPCMWTVS